MKYEPSTSADRHGRRARVARRRRRPAIRCARCGPTRPATRRASCTGRRARAPASSRCASSNRRRSPASRSWSTCTVRRRKPSGPPSRAAGLGPRRVARRRAGAAAHHEASGPVVGRRFRDRSSWAAVSPGRRPGRCPIAPPGWPTVVRLGAESVKRRATGCFARSIVGMGRARLCAVVARCGRCARPRPAPAKRPRRCRARRVRGACSRCSRSRRCRRGSPPR